MQQPATPPADAGLLERMADGDLDALGTLYDRYASDLLRFAKRMVGAHEAEDVVQSVFLRALGIAATFDPAASSARPWLFAIAVRVVRERRRSFRRFTNALFRLQQSGESTTEARGEAAQDLARGLAQLPESKRLVLLLAEVDEFSCPEIASMLDVPVGTVWTRLYHARRKLRAFLEGVRS
jgi:RNA polymerase sigma-70 factor (ECF subfamily)